MSKAVVSFELAHHQPQIHRALLDPSADGAAALLLQAQYLRQLGVGVAIHLGPLLPTIHDRLEYVRPLLQHISAAGISDVHLSLGRLTTGRLHALEQVLNPSQFHELQRIFFGQERATQTYSGSWRLAQVARYAFLVYVQKIVREHHLRIDECGCSAFCHLFDQGQKVRLPQFQTKLFAGQTAS